MARPSRRAAGAVAAATLVLAAHLAAAQMGPRSGMGSGMRERAPESEPAPAGSRAPAAPPAPAASPSAPAAGDMPAMTGQPMPHGGTPVPFYEERTFLLLAGGALVGAGLVGYRALRRRRGRRPLPAGYVNEAVLAVDLVGSTRLATHFGDGLAMRARNALRERLDAAAGGHGATFVESTGDGALVTFGSARDAVAAAIALLRDLARRPPDLGPGATLGVRIGISYGEILVDASGRRHAAAINRAFRLEGLGRESFAAAAGTEAPRSIAERDRIFVDEEAARELGPGDGSVHLVGFASLKGFPGLHRVYEVEWGAAAPARHDEDDVGKKGGRG